MAAPPFIIRKARKRDAPQILQCHREAIKAKASSFYDPKIIEAWGGAISGGQVEKVEQEISEPRWIYVVADHPEEGIIGIGIAVPDKNELRAVYVKPNPHGKVGTQILAALLEQARAMGCSHLDADSSINAEKFYVANGFRILSRGMHRMSAGGEMACVKMRIDLFKKK